MPSDRSEKLPEIVYSPDAQLRRPRQLLQRMLRDLLASRELAWRLFVRNISGQYRQSLLSYFWAFLPPIATTLIFVFLNDQRILEFGPTSIPYPAYVLTGTVLWQGFVDALNSPIQLVSSSRSMLAKINFPREALILAGLAEVLFYLSIRFVLVITVFFWFKVTVTPMILLAPVGIIALLAMGLMIGILLTPIGVLYQDISRGLAMVTTLWFFVTPVVYPPPTTWPTSLLIELNPVSPLLIITRDLLTTGTIANLKTFMCITAITFSLLFVGWLVYRLAMPYLVERMSG